MKDERVFIVTYDISDQKRWRNVFKLMKGYGQWLQLSVFQCRCSIKRYTELMHRLDRLIHHQNDHVLLIDLGDAESVRPKVVSLGKPYAALERKAVVV